MSGNPMHMDQAESIPLNSRNPRAVQTTVFQLRLQLVTAGRLYIRALIRPGRAPHYKRFGLQLKSAPSASYIC